MIVFTGGGMIAEAFQSMVDCRVMSFRALTDDQAMDVLRSAKVLVHNAAKLNPSNLSDSVESNFFLTKRLVELTREANPTLRFVYISSMSILKDEFHTKDAVEMSDYSFGKYLGELYVERSKLENWLILRFSTLFCKDATRDGLSRLVSDAVINHEITLLDDGKAARDFIPLEVACKYLHRFCIEHGVQGKFNIASGKRRTFREVASWISEVVGGIKVTSKEGMVVSDPVSTFSIEPLKRVGVIDHDLKDHVTAYCRSMMMK